MTEFARVHNRLAAVRYDPPQRWLGHRCAVASTMSAERILKFRKQVTECEHKAAQARTEETRRAWLIAARDWAAMAEREQAKMAASSEAAE